MNELLVEVNLYGKQVGVLAWNERKGLAEFQYFPDFYKTGWNVSPIIMPLRKDLMNQIYTFPSNRNNCFRGLPGMIADSLPDKYGNEIIDTWFAAHGISDYLITPLDRLCYIGSRAMGALEFVPSKNIKGLDESTILRMDSLVELADKVFRDRESFKKHIIQEEQTILDILRIGTSAGGAKPKALIALNDSTGEIRSGQVKAPDGFSYWLLKFDGTTFNENGYKIDYPQGIGNIEYAYHKMAVDCGIQMTECRLLRESNSYHFMTKRFDRTECGDKIHTQTLAAIAHYDRDSLHSYEQAFSVMRKLGLNYDEMEQFYRRMVFNVISRNHDDHTKNHSFLMDQKGDWRLAPAYDICYSYSPTGRWTSVHQMSINGKQDDMTWQDLVKVGEKMDIKNANIITDNIVNVVSHWGDYSKDNGVHADHVAIIQKNLRLLSPQSYIYIPDQSSVNHIGDDRKISDINFFHSAGNTVKIRCKINDEQQLGETLSQIDRVKYESIGLRGDKDAMNNFKEEMVRKYFTNELQNDNKHTIKR